MATAVLFACRVPQQAGSRSRPAAGPLVVRGKKFTQLQVVAFSQQEQGQNV
jgi:hypothetical protein